MCSKLGPLANFLPTSFMIFMWNRMQLDLLESTWRNSSRGKLREHFSMVLKYLSGTQPDLPDELCFFGEMAAFLVLQRETGEWSHGEVISQVGVDIGDHGDVKKYRIWDARAPETSNLSCRIHITS